MLDFIQYIMFLRKKINLGLKKKSEEKDLFKRKFK